MSVPNLTLTKTAVLLEFSLYLSAQPVQTVSLTHPLHTQWFHPFNKSQREEEGWSQYVLRNTVELTVAKWSRTTQGHAEDTAAWSGSLTCACGSERSPCPWDNAVMKQNHRPISRVWISCNFYCTFLFGLATTFHLFRRLRPRSWPNTQVGSGMKFPRVTDHRSDVHIPFTSEIWSIGRSYWSLICDPPGHRSRISMALLVQTFVLAIHISRM